MMRKRLSTVRLSISMRLTLWYGMSLFVLLSLFVVFLYTSFHLSLHRDFEEQLRRQEARLREAISVNQGRPLLLEEDVRLSVPVELRGDAGTYVRVFSSSGDLLYQSPNFSGRERFGVGLPDRVKQTEVSHTWHGAPARSRYVPIVDRANDLAGWLETTRLESAVHNELHRLRWLLALGVVLAAALAIATGYGLAGRALRPVTTLAAAARKIEAENLSRRLPESFGVRDELSDLAETLNALLERLDASFDRERRFRADAAHEMLTPLSALRSEIDVALRKPRDVTYLHATLSTLQTHVDRLSRVVETLLRLSWAEAIGNPEGKRCDAAQIARGVVGRARATAESRSLHIVCETAPRVDTAADPEHLEAVLENLIDNALKYTPAGGLVSVSAAIEDGEAVIRVSDTGIGVTGSEMALLFDRFYRADGRAVQQVRGSGLGLSIAKAVVDIYGGRITVQSPGRDQGTAFEVRMPLAEGEDARYGPV